MYWTEGDVQGRPKVVAEPQALLRLTAVSGMTSRYGLQRRPHMRRSCF